jgi:hypothetical protein
LTDELKQAELLATQLAIIDGSYDEKKNLIYGWHGKRGYLSKAQQLIRAGWRNESD